MRNIVLDDFRSNITTIDHLNGTSVDLNSMTVNFNKYLISLLNKHVPVCRKYMLMLMLVQLHLIGSHAITG